MIKSYDLLAMYFIPPLALDQRPTACNFIKKETPVQVFSCEFCEIFKNTYFVEHQPRVASFILLFRCGFIKFPYLLNTYRAWKDISNTVVAGQRIQAIPLDRGAYNQSQQLSSLIVLQLPVGVLMVRRFCFRVTKIFLFSKTFIIIPAVKGYLY